MVLYGLYEGGYEVFVFFVCYFVLCIVCFDVFVCLVNELVVGCFVVV